MGSLTIRKHILALSLGLVLTQGSSEHRVRSIPLDRPCFMNWAVSDSFILLLANSGWIIIHKGHFNNHNASSHSVRELGWSVERLACFLVVTVAWWDWDLPQRWHGEQEFENLWRGRNATCFCSTQCYKPCYSR